MSVNKIILEEIRRINYISNYKLNETSEENKKYINESTGTGGINALRDLLATREGTAALRSEFEAALSSGLEVRTIRDVGGTSKKLTKASEILKALKDNRVSEQSLLDLKGYVFTNSKNPSIIEAVAKDIVNSKEWERSYANLSDREIIRKLGKTSLKVKPGSEQAKAIIKAHEEDYSKMLKS